MSAGELREIELHQQRRALHCMAPGWLEPRRFTDDDGGVRVSSWHTVSAAPATRGCSPTRRGSPTRDSMSCVFDYRGFGGSDGPPRQRVSYRDQRADYHAAVAAARQLDGVDADRIILWGTSYSGGHVLPVAVADGRIAAIVSMTPAMDGLAAMLAIARHGGVRVLAPLVVHGVRDVVRALLRRAPHHVPIVGAPGSTAMIDRRVLSRVTRRWPDRRGATRCARGPRWRWASTGRSGMPPGSGPRCWYRSGITTPSRPPAPSRRGRWSGVRGGARRTRSTTSTSTTVRPQKRPGRPDRVPRPPPGDHVIGRHPEGAGLMSTYSVNNKVALVTGAARGIGFETARQLSERGARVALVDLDPVATAEPRRSWVAGAIGIAADVTDADAHAGRRRRDRRAARTAGHRRRQRRHRAAARRRCARWIPRCSSGSSTSTCWASTARCTPRSRTSRRAGGHVVVIASVYAFVNGVDDGSVRDVQGRRRAVRPRPAGRARPARRLGECRVLRLHRHRDGPRRLRRARSRSGSRRPSRRFLRRRLRARRSPAGASSTASSAEPPGSSRRGAGRSLRPARGPEPDAGPSDRGQRGHPGRRPGRGPAFRQDAIRRGARFVMRRSSSAYARSNAASSPWVTGSGTDQWSVTAGPSSS